MKHVPKYLLPRIAPVTEAEDSKEGFVPFKKDGLQRKGTKSRGRGGRGGARGGKSKSDPLKKFRR
jgi:ATP-dependent RNA helicase DDX56/DBP9